MTDADNAVVDHSAAPDWASRIEEAFCPLCEYNLRGLTTPRCPECGYTFTWTEVLDPRLGKHPYLFEHHPETNIRSYLRTAVGSWRPKKFWSSLHPRQQGKPARLLLYWLVGVFVLMPVSWGLIYAYAWFGVRNQNAYNAVMIAQTLQQQKRLLDSAAGLTDAQFARSKALIQQQLTFWTKQRAGWKDFFAFAGQARRSFYYVGLPLIVVPMLLWAWLTLLAMLVFQFSMRRAKIRHVHLLRCVIYSFDPLSFAVFVFLYAVLAPRAGPYMDNPIAAFGLYPSTDVFFIMGMVCLAAGILNGSIRLRAACKYYLRFDWPTSTVVATQIMAILATLTLLLNYHMQIVPRVISSLMN